MSDSLRAVIYARQSLDRSGDALGIARQREICVELCARRGWSVLEVIEDNDVSASSRKPRPGFQRLLGMVDRGELDAIVISHVDRLVRKPVELEDIIERCKSIPIVSCSGDLNLATDAGRLVGRVLTSFAKSEMERKSDRQARQQAQAALAGQRVGGRRPFGYKQDGMTIVPVEAAALRAAYSRFLAGGTLTGIAREWNRQGLRSSQTSWKPGNEGQPTQWVSTTVAGVLKNPRYAGLRAHNGVVVAQAEWPAIVSEDTWQAAVAILTDPSRERPHGARRLLTNIATCGVCGEAIHGGGAGHGKPVYRCRTMKHVNRLAEPVDDWIGRLVVAKLSRPDASELLVDDERPDVAALRDEAQAVRTRLDALSDQWADGVFTAAQVARANTRLKAKLADLEFRMADAGKVDVLGPIITAPDVRVAWDAMDVERRRAVVEAVMVVRVFPPGRGVRAFRPESVEVTWRS